jgi:hypothetical protein
MKDTVHSGSRLAQAVLVCKVTDAGFISTVVSCQLRRLLSTCRRANGHTALGQLR